MMSVCCFYTSIYDFVSKVFNFIGLIDVYISCNIFPHKVINGLLP